MGLTQLLRTGLGGCVREPVPQCPAAAGVRELRARRAGSGGGSRCNVRCGKHSVKIKQKGSTHEPEIKCLHLISEEEHVGQTIRWGFEPTVPWSARTFYWHQHQHNDGQEKHSVVCTSLLHPIPPFCDVLKGEVLHGLPERFDAVSITCFHLNPPVTDTVLIASGKAESLVCVVQNPPLPHSPTQEHDRGWQKSPSCLYSQCWTQYQPKRWQLGLAAENKSEQQRSSKKPKILQQLLTNHGNCISVVIPSQEQKNTEALPHPWVVNVVCLMQSY